jgi:predicted kinase
LEASFTTIVVDNTNCTIAEIAPYVALAQAYGAEVEIVRINIDPEIAHERNTHGLVLGSVLNQHAALKLLDKNWPRHWPKIREVSAVL